MKLRAKVNGNIIERDGIEAEALLESGYYERADAEQEPPADAPRRRGRPRGSYKRRDMKAEK